MMNKNIEKFIEDFFEISKKENILNDFKIEIDDLSRPIHTNSVYFLGALFMKN